jgi:hypothetical protein
MRKFFLAACLLLTIAASAQTSIKLEEVKSHIGDSIQTSGKISGVRYFPKAKGGPTLVNIGGAFPNQLLTVVIPDSLRSKMPWESVESFLQDKEVIVIGKIELYKEKPQIVISHLSQLQVIDK